ncbi:MAG: hypothetical protein KGH62_02085 [Candidatus Micrarchaeota archaeon]|nr:hypothetical protein [Candidatus Micrarchaeota archaeon]
MARKAPEIPIDSLIRGTRKLINNPRVPQGFRDAARRRLEKLEAAKARGVKTARIGEYG